MSQGVEEEGMCCPVGSQCSETPDRIARDQGSGNPVPSLAPHLGEAVMFSAVPVSRSGLFTFMGE